MTRERDRHGPAHKQGMDTIELIIQACWPLKWWILAAVVVLGAMFVYDRPFDPAVDALPAPTYPTTAQENRP